MRTLCSLQPSQTFTTWSYHRNVSGTQQPIPAGLQQGWHSPKSISWVPWGWTESKFFTMCRTNSYRLYLPLWCLIMHAFITTAALTIGREPHLKFASWLSWMTAVPERLTHEEWPHSLRAVSQNISASFSFLIFMFTGIWDMFHLRANNFSTQSRSPWGTYLKPRKQV